MAREMGQFIRFKRKRGPKPTGRHCTACGGDIYEGQETTSFTAYPDARPFTPNKGIKVTVYMHVNHEDCQKELRQWSDAGHGSRIDEWELNDQTSPGNTSRHLRQDQPAP